MGEQGVPAGIGGSDKATIGKRKARKAKLWDLQGMLAEGEGRLHQVLGCIVRNEIGFGVEEGKGLQLAYLFPGLAQLLCSQGMLAAVAD